MLTAHQAHPPPALAMHVWKRSASCELPGYGATICTGMIRQHLKHAPGSSSLVGVCSSLTGSSCASSYSSTYSGSVSPMQPPHEVASNGSPAAHRDVRAVGT